MTISARLILLCCTLGLGAGAALAADPAEPEPVEQSLAGEWRATPPQPGETGCFAHQTRPAVIETVTEQELVSPEQRDPATGQVTRPATYRSASHQRIVEGRAEMWFPAPCPAAMTADFVASLQRALQVRGLYAGPVSGVLDIPTHAAIRAYQAPRGLVSATLSIRAAQEMGLLPWLEDVK